MTGIVETDVWPDDIYQIETTDPVMGGPDGIDNLPHKQLAARTRHLRAVFNDLVDRLTVKLVDASDTARGLIELATIAEALAGTDVERAVTPAGLKAAVGSAAGTRSIPASTVLTADDVGKVMAITAPSPIMVTLPPLAAVSIGATISFVNVGQARADVVSADGDRVDQGRGLMTGMTVGIGDTLSLVSRGSLWSPVGGSASLDFAAAFASTLGPTGRQRLPGGLILQWMTVSPIATGEIYTLPVAFPSAHWGGVGASFGAPAALQINPIGPGQVRIVPSITGFPCLVVMLGK